MTEEYRVNEKFRKFVDAYCIKHEIDRETAMTHALIKGIENTYRQLRLEKEAKEDGDRAAGQGAIP